MTTVYIADTGFIIAIGQPSNERYQRTRTFFERVGSTLVLPQRVYEELTTTEIPNSRDPLPVDSAIEDGWMRIAQPIDYSIPIVSKTMDGVQRYIAAR